VKDFKSFSDYYLSNKLWGYEEWIVNLPKYCGKIFKYNPIRIVLNLNQEKLIRNI
jgi:hypothetical protein